jgi:hypothetical protein
MQIEESSVPYYVKPDITQNIPSTEHPIISDTQKDVAKEETGKKSNVASDSNEPYIITLYPFPIDDAKEKRSRLIFKYEEKLGDMKKDYLDKINDNETQCNDHIFKVEEEKEALIRQRDLAVAELRAVRVQNGLVVPSDDLTSRERFEELENEFEAFNKFFKEQWTLTKKAIRKQLLWEKIDKEEFKKKVKEEKALKAKNKNQKKNEKTVVTTPEVVVKEENEIEKITKEVLDYADDIEPKVVEEATEEIIDSLVENEEVVDALSNELEVFNNRDEM